MYQFTANDVEVTGSPEPKSGGMQTGTIPRGIKVLHKATGIVVICDKHRQQLQNREEAFSQLDAKLTELARECD